MTRPDLSVVIAAYDAEATLGEQLAALADQEVTFAWEVLVCDNGSTDGTPALVRQWQQRLPGLRLIDASARRGPAAARNTGVRHALAPLIAFCDADDVVGQGWLAAMHTALQHDHFVAGDTLPLDGPGRGSVSWIAGGTYTHPLLPHLPAAGAGNMGIRKAVFDEVGGFAEAMATNEDTDLSWRVQLVGYPLVHHPEIVLHVRRREGLRAVFRRARASGRGERQLRHRYAEVVAATPQASAGAPTAERARPARRGRVLAKLRTVRRPEDLADQVWRLGFALGKRLGTGGPPLDRIPPPPP